MVENSTFQSLRESEREIRKNLIITAAVELLRKEPFYEIGMRDIAAKAGISAASLYRYFPGRDDLIVEALLLDINSIVKLLEKQLQKETSIESIAISVVDYLVDNDSTFQMMCHFLIRGKENSQALKKFNAVQLYFAEKFNLILKNNALKNIKDLHTQAFFASLAGIVMMFRNFPGLNKKQRRERMHKMALLIMQKGITTE